MHRALTVALLAALVMAAAFHGASASDGGKVLVASIDGVINPVTAEYIQKAVAAADEQDAALLVLKLDTPGGLDSSMRDMVKAIVGSRVPVVTYVSPSGARAASAGVFITMASHVAAMTPGTNIGAAHPVAMGGGELDETMAEKLVNDSAAYISSLAAKRGRNAAWAEDSVRKSVSIPDSEALELHVVEYVSDDVTKLLGTLDGKKVQTAYGEVTLATKGAEQVAFDMGSRLKLLKAISDPNIAYILMMIGLVGIYFELSNPGLILPGVLGGIALVLAFYSLQTLPVNYAGVLLIILGVVFFILELHITSYGLLSVAGLIALVLGSVMLIDSPLPFMRVSYQVLLPVAVTFGVLAAILARVAIRSQRSGVSTGPEGLVGEHGVARTDIDPDGQVYVHGAYWSAYSGVRISKDEDIIVVSVEGLKLKVKKR